MNRTGEIMGEIMGEIRSISPMLKPQCTKDF